MNTNNVKSFIKDRFKLSIKDLKLRLSINDLNLDLDLDLALRA